MMIYSWYHYYPHLAKLALTMFVRYSELDQKPLGSWKDIKYMCLYIKNQFDQDKNQDQNTVYEALEHPLTQFCIELMNGQLKKDDEIYHSSDPSLSNRGLSLVCKWIPRENSKKFGWMFDPLSSNYFPQYLASAYKSTSVVSAQKKCNTEYRILLAKLNRHMDTVQIKQCAGRWSEIDYSTVSSTTMALQHRAFSNIALNTETGTVVRSVDPDREEGAQNYRMFREIQFNYKKTAIVQKEKTVTEMVGDVIYALNCRENSVATSTLEYKVNRLDWEWARRMEGKSATTLGYIPVVDASLAMGENELYNAIALGSCILTNKEQNTPLNKHALSVGSMTFASDPLWLYFAKHSTFHERVHHFMQNRSFSGGYLNLFTLYIKLLSHLTEYSEHYTPEEIAKMQFCVFTNSTFQENLNLWFYGTKHLPFYKADNGREMWKQKYQAILEKYEIVGKTYYGCALTPPKLLFWDLRKVDTTPSVQKDDATGISYINGSTESMIDEFCRRGMDGLFQKNPLSNLARHLENPRYYIHPTDIYINQPEHHT